MNGGKTQKFLWIATGLLSLAFVILIGLTASGLVKIVWSPNKNAVITPNICTSKQVEKHNALLGDGAVLKEEYKSLYDEVTKQSGYNNDMTCVYLAAQYGIIAQDKDITVREVKRLEQLSQQGQGISLAISPMNTLTLMKSMSQALSSGASLSDGE